ncbi:MAG: hypothetical protein H0U23_00635 [Blastocatellia bacterium]|nr:hypothetical protein [Blastocatellia bacterium]
MSKPAAKPFSTATRPIAPPPLSQHLCEFAARPEAWSVFARNLIPVVGIYFFGWSAALTVFNYWFDGLAALAAIIAVLIPRAMRESQSKTEEGGQRSEIGAAILNTVRGVVTWVFLLGLVGLPYWIVLIPLHDLLLSPGLRYQLAYTPALWFAFGSLAAGHLWKALRMGYDQMPENQLKQRVRWDVYILVLRAVAMFVMAAQGLAFILVPLMALLLTYGELWPERVLGAVFGDPSRLYEYDPDNPAKTRRPR